MKDVAGVLDGWDFSQYAQVLLVKKTIATTDDDDDDDDDKE